MTRPSQEAERADWIPIAELPHHRHGLVVPIALGWAGALN
jgi:8-oxo-dGTP diphosphatase